MIGAASENPRRVMSSAALSPLPLLLLLPPRRRERPRAAVADRVADNRRKRLATRAAFSRERSSRPSPPSSPPRGADNAIRIRLTTNDDRACSACGTRKLKHVESICRLPAPPNIRQRNSGRLQGTGGGD